MSIATVRFLCPACKAVMDGPPGKRVNCVKCGQALVPLAQDASAAVPAPAVQQSPYPAPEHATAVAVGVPSVPADSLTARMLQPSFTERILPKLAWACYGGVWLSFAFMCVVILVPSGALAILGSLFSFLLTGVTLCLSLYTFTASVRCFSSKQSATALAALICSTLTTVYCTLSLMCGCVWGVTVLKGIDTLHNLGGQPRPFF